MPEFNLAEGVGNFLLDRALEAISVMYKIGSECLKSD